MLSKSKPQAVKPVKNTFTIIQVKKMIGKKLIVPWKGLNIPPQELKENAKKVIKKIIESSHQKGTKKLVLTTVCINGILNIIGGLERYTAISMISYKEIEKLDTLGEICVIIIQHPKISQANIKNLIILNSK
jgi:hypothetical protein